MDDRLVEAGARVLEIVPGDWSKMTYAEQRAWLIGAVCAILPHHLQDKGVPLIGRLVHDCGHPFNLHEGEDRKAPLPSLN